MYDLLTKLIAFMAATFGVYKVLVEVMAGNFSRRKEQYLFSKDYTDEFLKGGMNGFVSGLGMYALIQRPMSDAEIRYLLNTDFPFRSIYLRKEVNKLVDFSSSDGCYLYSDILKKTFWRKIAKPWYYMAYFASASFAIFPVAYKAEVVMSNSSVAIICVLMAITAVLSLFKAHNIQSAHDFIAEFGCKKPTSSVVQAV